MDCVHNFPKIYSSEIYVNESNKEKKGKKQQIINIEKKIAFKVFVFAQYD